MKCRQWVVDAVFEKTSALTLKARCQFTGLRSQENVAVEFPET
jgi:hypothetical protein